MSSFEDLPFKSPMGPLDEPPDGTREVRAPDLNIPDCLQILRDTTVGANDIYHIYLKKHCGGLFHKTHSFFFCW